MGSLGAQRIGGGGTITIRSGMSREEIDRVSTQIANEAGEAWRVAQESYNDVSRRAGTEISVDDAINLSNSIREDYNKKMERLRALNRRLTELYNISVTLR